VWALTSQARFAVFCCHESRGGEGLALDGIAPGWPPVVGQLGRVRRAVGRRVWQPSDPHRRHHSARLT
jgi:hypothetical protein